MSGIEVLEGQLCLPDSPDYPAEGDGTNVVLKVKSLGHTIVFEHFAMGDHRDSHEEMAKNINDLLEQLDDKRRLHFVDCGDDQYYFIFCSPGELP